MTGPFPDWIYRQSAILPFRRKSSRSRGRDLEVLLVSTRDGKRWTFPKGIVEPGMSAGEVTARCGHPTSITSHITGKQFIPFNFKGGDTVRSYYLYKGQGVVVVANDSAWTSGTHVIEVQFDENEPGFR